MRSRLAAAVLALVALQAIHSLDHILRHDERVPAELRPVGILGFVGAALVLLAVLRRHRLAPLLVAAYGFVVAIGFVVIHVAPDWGPFSQPYAELDVDGFSWAGMIVPAAAALVVGLAGLRVLRTPA